MKERKLDDPRYRVVITVELILEVRIQASEKEKKPLPQQEKEKARGEITRFRAFLDRRKPSLSDVIRWAKILIETWHDWF